MSKMVDQLWPILAERDSTPATYDDDVRALVAAMREPTKDMLDAVYEAAVAKMRREHSISPGDSLDFLDRREIDVMFVLYWRAAIDAALK